MQCVRRLRAVEPTTTLLLVASLALAAIAVQQYLGGVYGGAVVLAVGSILASLFAVVA